MGEFISIAKYMFKESIRNKGTIFSILIFPLILSIIFGSAFLDNENQELNLGIVCDESIKDHLKNMEDSWNLIFYENEDDMYKHRKMLDALIWVSNHTVRILKKPRNMNAISYLELFKTTLKTFLEKKLNSVKDIIMIRKQEIHIGNMNIRPVDYLLGSFIALSILYSGMFGVITLFSRYRELGILKRFKVSPVGKLPLVLGFSFSRFLLVFLASFILIGIGTIMFHGKYSINPLLFAVTVISSTLGMMAFGIILSLFFKSATAANNFASIVSIIMCFFSGIYFPITFLPPKLRILSFFMPPRYVADTVRYSLGFENISILNFLVINSIFLILGSALLWIAGKMSMKLES